MHIEGNSTTSFFQLETLKRYGLNLVSVLFKGVSYLNLKRKALGRRKFPAFIISVDNLSFGGTGKTTLVTEIGKNFEATGIGFAIITRGYKSRLEKTGATVKVGSHHTVEDVGDEASLFYKSFPNGAVYIGKDRIKSIGRAIEDGNNVILLDDGFQTTNVCKDVSVMLVNPQHPYYYLRNFKGLMKWEDYVFFYGESGDSRDDGCDGKDANTGAGREKGAQNERGGLLEGEKQVTGTYYFESAGFHDIHGEAVDIGNASLFGFSALGDNDRFERDLGAFNLALFQGFGDHHSYESVDIEVLDLCRKNEGIDYLVCTEKDYIKIFPMNLQDYPLIYVKNRIKFNIDLMGRLSKFAVEFLANNTDQNTDQNTGQNTVENTVENTAEITAKNIANNKAEKIAEKTATTAKRTEEHTEEFAEKHAEEKS